MIPTGFGKKLASYVVNKLTALYSRVLGLEFVEVSPDPNDPDFDRLLAESDFMDSVNEALQGDSSHAIKQSHAQALASHQEEQRARRDVKIATLGHKELVLSLVRGAYATVNQLNYETEGGQQ